jgi:hypothetical protein
LGKIEIFKKKERFNGIYQEDDDERSPDEHRNRRKLKR